MISKTAGSEAARTVQLLAGPAGPASAARSRAVLVGPSARQKFCAPATTLGLNCRCCPFSLPAGPRQASSRKFRLLRSAAPQEGDSCHPAVRPTGHRGPLRVVS